jgi:nucleoside-diphosphate kinase
VNAGLTGKIIDAVIKGGFAVTDVEVFNLERVNAEEFLEVYKGVVPEYHVRFSV